MGVLTDGRRGADAAQSTTTKLALSCQPKELRWHTGTLLGWENAALWLSLWLSERQKEKTLKYLINVSAKAFEPRHEESENSSYFTSTEDTTKTASYDPDYRRLPKLVSFPISSSEAELAAASLEIFQNCFNLSFSFCLEWHRMCTLGALEVTGSKSLSREGRLGEIQSPRVGERKQGYSICIFNATKFS